MAVNIGDILEVTVQSTVLSQQVMTVLHYAVTAVPTNTDPISSQGDFLNLIGDSGTYDMITPYRACCGNTLTVNNLTAQYIWPIRYVRTTGFVGLTGTVSEGVRTANVSSMIEKISDFAGKKNRGAIHMPGLVSSAQVDGILSSGQQALNLALSTALLRIVFEDLGTGRWEPIILHRTHPFIGTFVPWKKSIIQKTVRVQRRRTVGVGK